LSLRRLLDEPGATTVEEEVGRLGLVDLAHGDRPYVVTNFVVTADGRATLQGRSGPIGSSIDTAMLVALRAVADAVMIGAGTMRAERYGRALKDPAKRAARERNGLEPDPLMVLVSGRLDLPWDAPLFTEGGGHVVVFTASAAEAPSTATPVEVVRHPDGVDLADALRHLRAEHGVRALLCEGGPHLHGNLIRADLVDELFITLAPKLGGGEGPGLASGLPEHERPLELKALLEADGELFARYGFVAQTP